MTCELVPLKITAREFEFNEEFVAGVVQFPPTYKSPPSAFPNDNAPFNITFPVTVRLPLLFPLPP